SPAHGFEFLGIKFFEEQSEIDAESVIVDPTPYKVTLTINAADGLEPVIRNASALVADEAEPASGAAGLLAKARGDYRRLVAALYNEGHYGGTVSIRVNGQEAANLAPDVKLASPVAVAVVVDPGPLFSFNHVTIVNQAVPS